MSEEQRFADLDACVEHWRDHWNIPGIGVAVLRDGEITSSSFGITSIDTQQPVTDGTVFQIGSISKLYTSTLAMILVDEGKIDVDEPVVTYLPSLKLKDDDALKVISLRHLLSHTSGVFGDFFDDFGMGDDALKLYIEAMANLRQVYKPGELWSYTNSGFNLAGYLVERLLDMPFEDAMREKLLKPAGLDQTFQFPHEAITYPLAVGHIHPNPEDEGTLEIARRYPLPRTSHAAGGIIATASDVLRFAQLHMNGGKSGDQQVLSSDTVSLMQQPVTKAAGLADEWGLGWMLFDVAGTKVIGHGGTTNGFQAVMRIVPEHNFAIAILNNSDRGHAAETPILKWALKHYLGVETPERQSVLLDESRRDRYVGKYTQPLADIIVSNQNGKLTMDVIQKSALADTDETKKMPTVGLQPVGDREFLIESGPAAGSLVDFVDNADGSVRFIRVGGRFADRVTE